MDGLDKIKELCEAKAEQMANDYGLTEEQKGLWIDTVAPKVIEHELEIARTLVGGPENVGGKDT